MMKTAKLLLHCPDKPGILAEYYLSGPICRSCGEYLFHAYRVGIEELPDTAREN